jgi:hypothetical protein
MPKLTVPAPVKSIELLQNSGCRLRQGLQGFKKTHLNPFDAPTENPIDVHNDVLDVSYQVTAK